MALKSAQYVFFNEANPEESITVQDQHSANVLSEVLKTHAAVWVLKEEYAKPANSIGSAPLARPSALTPAPAAPPSVAHAPVQTQDFFDDAYVDEPAFLDAETTQTELKPVAPQTLTPPPLKAQPKAASANEERRAQKRFSVDLRIILISKGRSFRSISQDVSLGGMRLKNRVPSEFAGESCTAYISNMDSKENIEMVCTVISDPKDPRRVKFTEADSEQLKRLNRWLVDKEVVKKAS